MPELGSTGKLQLAPLNNFPGNVVSFHQPQYGAHLAGQIFTDWHRSLMPASTQDFQLEGAVPRIREFPKKPGFWRNFPRFFALYRGMSWGIPA